MAQIQTSEDVKKSRSDLISPPPVTKPDKGPPKTTNREAAWVSQTITLTDGSTETVLINDQIEAGVTYVLPQVPRLVYGSGGGPILNLSLILNKAPAPSETNIQPLIEGGMLVIELQTGVDKAVLDSLALGSNRNYQRLFARKVVYSVSWSGGIRPEQLAQAEGQGTEARAALNIRLSREQTLEVLDALDQNPSRLRCSAQISYRIAIAAQTVHLSGSWAAIHRFLSRYQDAEGQLTEADLYRLIPQLAAEGIVLVEAEGGSTEAIAPETLARLFMRQSSVILQQAPSFSGAETVYTLRPEPHESFHLDYTEKVSGWGLKTVELGISFSQLLGGVLVHQNWDDYVHLVAQQPGNPAVTAPVARRVRAEQSRRAPGNNNLEVVASGNKITSVSLASKPNATASIAVRPYVKPQVETAVMLDDVYIAVGEKEPLRHLPVVVDINAPYWPDRIARLEHCWYAPEFTLVTPAADVATDSSPFHFSFERTGVTSSGKPALKGTIRFTLQPDKSSQTAEALSNNGIATASAVPVIRMVVFLTIPFVDESDGTVKQHAFSTTMSRSGEAVICEVELLNDWVRLAYGALSVAGFQSEKVGVQITYAFTAYVPVQKDDLVFTFGGKALYTPIVYSNEEREKRRGTSYLDATTMTYVQPGAELRYRALSAEEEQARAPGRRARFPKAIPLHAATTAATSVAVSTVRPHETIVTARPEVAVAVHEQLTLNASIAALVAQVEYGICTQVRRQAQELFFPCNLFGRFYQEVQNGTATSIGCQEALTLGQTRYRLYEEITEIQDPDYKVYRSLPQPGQFLVVPDQFCISRREKGQEDAYRPLIFLNALLDVDTPANNRVELRATLQPDFPEFKRAALLERLKAFDSAPSLHYLTDLAAESVTFNWALDPGMAANSQASVLDTEGPFISTYFGMDLASWQLMKKVLETPGLSGSVSFTLADESVFHSNLLLKLDRILGPWENGPLDTQAADGQVKITNCIDRAIEVSDLVRYAGSAVAERVPVEASIAAGGTYQVSTGSTGLLPVYSLPPGDPVAIEEVRSFVEEIYRNVVFINLLNFSNHQLLRLDVEARVQGVEGTYTGQLTEQARIFDIEIILPLTTYLERHTLEVRVTKLFSDRAAETSDWFLWELDQSGPVSLTKEILNL
ncbi:hypothetical protein OCK74_12275 [Chitinophagaceae bacterium LB-8]|uniref:Uncharacterized protein n=1 Tax=Paraflavisolibacter caeni TaxID=2982496 RepID=A0A9X2XP48_9BACT|nr:hypothetical protein [Paraflavisolibacter caeni]MCU7549899.1 hypothetical protein [Paraflavisolibacter caeni]